MSVINQMLNQLEERGVNTAAEQGMVRAVPHIRRNWTVPSLLAVVVLLAGIAAWQWMHARNPNRAASDVPVADVSAPVASVTPVVPVADKSARIEPRLHLSGELGSLPLPSPLRNSAVVPVLPKAAAPAVSAGQGPVLKTTESVSASTSGSAPAKPASIATSDSPPPIKQVSAGQQADAEFRKAVALMQQGRINDALAGYEAVLRIEPGHDAGRQALAALLLENKRSADAERVLQEGLKIKPENTVFAMSLARLQVERGAVTQSVETLEKHLPQAGSQADYHAFLAALLQRQNRNDEAIMHYQIALQAVPGNGAWLMGYGISLQALRRNDEAREAYQRALETQTLSSELQAFVQQKIKGL